MNIHLNERERELIKAASHFKKKATSLVERGKLGEEHMNVVESCDKLVEQINAHSNNRAVIYQQFENVKKIIQDNAECPRCHSGNYLKHRNVFTNEQGWKMNRYNCRRCHIEFVWNRPNNPWDIIKFVEQMVTQLDKQLEQAGEDAGAREQTLAMRAQLLENVARIKPVLEEAEKNMKDVQEKDEQMAQMLHEYKNYLLIEKIKLDTWENQK